MILKKISLSESLPVRISPVPYFFIANMHGEPGTWTAFFNFAKQIGKGTELETLAGEKSWRSKLQYRYKKAVGKEHSKNIPLSFGMRTRIAEKLRERRGRHDSEEGPVTVWWFLFEEITYQIYEEYPDSPISYLYLFLVKLRNQELDSEETLMLMLCAYLEWISLELLVIHGNRDNWCDSFFVPITSWVPQVIDGKLRTTRNIVLNEVFRKYDDRNFRHLLGKATGYDKSNLSAHRKLNVDHAMIELMKNPEVADLITGDYHFRALFNFVSFFEWMQLDMLLNNIPAELIVDSFSRLPVISDAFEQGLYRYFSEN